MSEERNKDEEERLKKELKEWIDHRIADNNAFISSPKKETLSLLFALFPPLGYLRLMAMGHSKTVLHLFSPSCIHTLDCGRYYGVNSKKERDKRIY